MTFDENVDRKVYPANPPRVTPRPPKTVPPSEQEMAVAKEVLANLIIFGGDNDPFQPFADALGSTRHRAKEVTFWILHRRPGGYIQKYLRELFQVRAALAARVKKYTEFVDNPETIYQIVKRAEDEAEEKEQAAEERRKQKGASK